MLFEKRSSALFNYLSIYVFVTGQNGWMSVGKLRSKFEDRNAIEEEEEEEEDDDDLFIFKCTDVASKDLTIINAELKGSGRG